jgi:hypothetical protein
VTSLPLVTRTVAVCGLAFAALAWARPLDAQVVQPPVAAPQAPTPPLGVSPRGAMVRAMLLPGWGHAAIGSYSRGGFYVAIESLTAYTFLRTRARLSDARDRAALRESFLRAGLAAGGVTDPVAVDAALAGDAPLQGLESLVASREDQQEDLVAFGIFVVFLTGADAFVSAHLARFPAPIDVSAAPSPDGGVELGIRVPVR